MVSVKSGTNLYFGFVLLVVDKEMEETQVFPMNPGFTLQAGNELTRWIDEEEVLDFFQGFLRQPSSGRKIRIASGNQGVGVKGKSTKKQGLCLG